LQEKALTDISFAKKSKYTQYPNWHQLSPKRKAFVILRGIYGLTMVKIADRLKVNQATLYKWQVHPMILPLLHALARSWEQSILHQKATIAKRCLEELMRRTEGERLEGTPLEQILDVLKQADKKTDDALKQEQSFEVNIAIVGADGENSYHQVRATQSQAERVSSEPSTVSDFSLWDALGEDNGGGDGGSPAFNEQLRWLGLDN